MSAIDDIREYAMCLGVSAEAYETMLCYLRALLEKNKEINLTSITDYNDALSLHLLDSLAGLPFMNEAPEGLVGDLGSGCGVPGVFLAIATGRKAHMIDSVAKKMKAVSQILSKMALDEQITCIGARIEELGKTNKGQYQVLTCRAMDKLPVILELASPLLAIGGRLIAYKGALTVVERDRARSVCDIVGMQEIALNRFTLAYDNSDRTICVYEKTAEPTILLPRRNGMAHKKPLA